MTQPGYPGTSMPGSGGNENPLDETMPIPPPSGYASPGQLFYTESSQSAQYPQAGYAGQPPCGQPPYGQPPYGLPPYGQPNKPKVGLWALVGVLVVAVIVGGAFFFTHNSSKPTETSTTTVQQPTDPQPTDPAEPTDPQPTDPQPTQPQPTDPAEPTDPQPTQPSADGYCSWYNDGTHDGDDIYSEIDFDDSATINDDVAKSLDVALQDFQQGLSLNPPSAAVGPLIDLISIVQSLKTTASQGDLAATKQAFAGQEHSFYDAGDALDTASQQVCQ